MQLIDPFPGHYDAADPYGSTTGRSYPHTGSDWPMAGGAAIPAIGAGLVVNKQWHPGNGNTVTVQLEDGHYYAYLHMASPADVNVGEHVAIGRTVGRVGQTGTNARGNHLHVTVSDSPQAYIGLGHTINPWAFILSHHAGGDGDAEVRTAQTALVALGYDTGGVDGIKGPKTEAAVRDFQTKRGLVVDGLIGPATLAALAASSPATPPSSRRSLQRGSTGQDVADLQAFLNRVYPAYSDLVVDGDFGPATDAVVREFQRRAGLTVDGIVGPATYGKLGL